MKGLMTCIILSLFSVVLAAEPLSIESLLQQVKQGHHQDQQLNEQRLQGFICRSARTTAGSG